MYFAAEVPVRCVQSLHLSGLLLSPDRSCSIAPVAQGIIGGCDLQVASRQASFASRQTSARSTSRGLSMRLPSRQSLRAPRPLWHTHDKQGMQIIYDLYTHPG